MSTVADAELDHVRTWIFDLDQTLYPAEARLFDQINARMTGFIMRELALPRGEADRLRDRLWSNYGTTLSGLMAEFRIEPEPFLAEAHDIDLARLRPDPDLAAAIRALPGRRIVHTNGSRVHAGRVLAARGLSEVFDAVYAIEDKALVPKPEAAAYAAVAAAEAMDPSRALMIEDHAENLVVPKAMGMTTVWLAPGPGARTPNHVDRRIADLTRFLTGLG